MKDINLNLRNCLLESFLLEDEKSKIEKVKESISNWLKEIKLKLKSVLKLVKEKVTLVFAKIKPNEEPDEKATKEKVDRLEKAKAIFDNLLKGFSRNSQELDTVLKDLEKANSGMEELGQRMDKITEKLDKRNEMLDDLKNLRKGKLGPNKRKHLEEAGYTMDAIVKLALARKGELFKTYKSIVNFLMSDIKNAIDGIAFNIRVCESILKDQNKGMVEVKNGKAKTGLTLSQKFKVYSFVFRQSFKRVAINIGTFVRITDVALALGITNAAYDVINTLKGNKFARV